MNANDMATSIHAFPDVVNLYFAVQGEIEEEHMSAIMTGFVKALERIRISHAPYGCNIGKIETASLDEIISLGVPNKGGMSASSCLAISERTRCKILIRGPAT